MSKIFKVAFSPLFIHEVEKKQKKKKPTGKELLKSDNYGMLSPNLFFKLKEKAKKKK